MTVEMFVLLAGPPRVGATCSKDWICLSLCESFCSMTICHETKLSAECISDTPGEFCTGFESTVLENLVNLNDEVKEIRTELAQTNLLIQSLHEERSGDYELQMPDGISLPLSSEEDVDRMETALLNEEFCRRLVQFTSSCFLTHQSLFMNSIIPQ